MGDPQSRFRERRNIGGTAASTTSLRATIASPTIGAIVAR
jgi:hypothetical protein